MYHSFTPFRLARFVSYFIDTIRSSVGLAAVRSTGSRKGLLETHVHILSPTHDLLVVPVKIPHLFIQALRYDHSLFIQLNRVDPLVVSFMSMSMRKCRFCQREMTGGILQCSYCGSDQSVECPKCHVSNLPTRKSCQSNGWRSEAKIKKDEIEILSLPLFCVDD